MNLLRNQVLQNISLAIDAYYCKTSYALYRFKSRINLTRIAHVPSIFGEESLEKLEKKIENPLIRTALRIPEHPEEPYFPDEYSLKGPPLGRIYDKYPFKFRVEKGKTYLWCSCGCSGSQPFCDFTHKMLWGRHVRKRLPKFRPIKYTATETKDIWFCNCKQSSTRPFCDGTHKKDEIKSAIKDV